VAEVKQFWGRSGRVQAITLPMMSSSVYARKLEGGQHAATAMEHAMSQGIKNEPNASPSLPPGFVGREKAAQISRLGITAWNRWEAEGKLPFGQWFVLPGGGRCRIYPAEAVQQMAQELSFPPPGTVVREEAARLCGLGERTFYRFEKQGKVTCGKFVTIPGSPGKCKIYPVEELRQLKLQWERELEQAQRQLEPYPDPNLPGVVRVPIVSDKHKGLEALVDADVLPLVQGKRWNWSGGRAGGAGASVVIPGGGSMARVILGIADNAELLVSHVNGDRLDCRRENLVVRTRSQVRRAAKPPCKWEGFEPYADPDRPSVVRVPVRTMKHKGMEALIDASDLHLVQGKHWHWSPGKPGSPITGCKVLSINGTPKPSLARIILGIEDQDQLVSHLNGDHLDCRRENLVVRTRVQVRRASRKARIKNGRECSSRFKGVMRTQSGRKWAAAISINGKYRNLGRFRSEIDAALAYDAALRELMGADVAGLNLPDPAEVQRLRALEPVVETDSIWPPPGMVDRHEACAMFGVSLSAWMAWERKGRITCGRYHRLPNDRPGQCKLYPKEELERTRVEIEKLGKPYPDPDRPGVWRVPLRSYLAYREALIDEADLHLVEGKHWNWSDRTDGRVEGIVINASMTDQTPLARIITNATKRSERIRYVNGDPLDCRRANLALLTLSQQVQGNRKMDSICGRKCSSTYKGVSFEESRGQWIVQIRKGRVYSHVGRFPNEIEAAKAYDAAARVLFGEHGHFNFPDQPSTENAIAEARIALDSDLNRARETRRRQRDLERSLRAAAVDDAAQEQTSPEDNTMLSADTSRQLFDVSSPVWRRWEQFGWLPSSLVAEDGSAKYPIAGIRRLLLRCGIVALPYPDPQRAGVYRVPLSGEVANGREALIDADAVPLVQIHRWRFAEADTGRHGEVQTMVPSDNIRLHYVVMGMTSDEQYQIAHRNDDPLDCRRENLVVRTRSDTNAHKRKSATFCGRPCTSRFKGVCWDRRRERWIAYIKKEHVKRSLGSFSDEIAAAQTYDEAARDLFGEHARPNFPNGVDAWLAEEAKLLETEEGARSNASRQNQLDQARAA
jgi:hypothetical protein